MLSLPSHTQPFLLWLAGYGYPEYGSDIMMSWCNNIMWNHNIAALEGAAPCDATERKHK